MNRVDFLLAAEINAWKRTRKAVRENKLVKAVNEGLVYGARVILRNGVRGKIVKINKTRFRVEADNGQIWNAHPGAMLLETCYDTLPKNANRFSVYFYSKRKAR